MGKIKEVIGKVATKVAQSVGEDKCVDCGNASKPLKQSTDNKVVYRVRLILSEKMYNKEVNRYLFVNPFTNDIVVVTLNDVQLETTDVDLWRLNNDMMYKGYYDSVTIAIIK